jgi:hypothetical protein
VKKNSSIWKNILLLLAGVACLYYGYKAASTSSSSWSTTTGQVVSTDVTANDTDDIAGDDEYYVEITYAYTVDGAEHKTSFNTRFVSQSDAEEELNQYPVGKELTVYYLSDDPGTATLSPSENKTSGYIGLITGIVLIGMGAWGFRSRAVSSETPS